jgi:demethylphylloquinone reductase
MRQTSNPTIILGGGFVGLFTALHLSHQNYQHPIVLIDRHDRFSFKPLLYELLSGELHAKQVYPRYDNLLAGSGVRFVQDTVQAIDLHHKRVLLTSGRDYAYSNLVLALGSKTTYFDTPGAAEYSLPLTSGAEAIALRDRLQAQLRRAVMISDPKERCPLLTVAIIGAGPAGIELACTLGELLPLWYEDLGGDIDEVRVVLINRSRELLKGDVNSRLRSSAQQSLRQRGVELLFDAAVTAIHPDAVEFTKGDRTHSIKAGTIAWTAGTAPNPLLMELPIKSEHRDRRGRLLVKPTLQLPDFPEVFAAGDCATNDADPQPPTAQVAYQQGKAIAQNLVELDAGNALLPANVHLRGTLMKLGLNDGVANLFDKFEIKGQPGHLIRTGTYLELLPNLRHNVKVTADWLTDEIFQRHRPVRAQRLGQTPWLSGMATIAASLLIATPLVWRAAQPTQFQQQMNSTGMPTLLDRMAPDRGDTAK